MIVSITEVCRITGIYRLTLVAAIKSGELPARRTPERVEVNSTDLRRWIINCYWGNHVSRKKAPLDRLDAQTPEGQWLIEERTERGEWHDAHYWRERDTRFGRGRVHLFGLDD